MPNLKSHYTLSLGVGLVSIGPLRDGWWEWDPFIEVRAGRKVRAGRWGVVGVDIFKYLILILGPN